MQSTPSSPGTELVARPRSASAGLGVTNLLARVSGLALGATGIAVRSTVEAVERFVPDGGDAPPAIVGPMGRLLHTAPGLALSAAYATRSGMLVVSAGVERTVTGALSVLGRPGPLAAPVNRVAESIEDINRWAFGEQQYNEMLVAEFARRSAPAVAESLVASIDLPDMVQQIPVTQIVQRIDLNAVIAQVDLNRIIADIDIRPIASQVIDEIDIPGIVRATTTSMTGDLIEANRVVFMHLDGGIARGADAVIRPRHHRQPRLVGYDPSAIEERPGGDARTDARARIVPMDAIRSDYARERQGVRAGFATRALAAGLDIVAIMAIGFLISLVVGFFQFMFAAEAFALPELTRGAALSFTGGLAVLYYTLSWTTTGRSVGDAIMGLRVVTESGNRVRLVRSFLRAIVVTAIGTPCLFWAIVSKKNAALFDLPLKTTVVYDWTIN